MTKQLVITAGNFQPKFHILRDLIWSLLVHLPRAPNVLLDFVASFRFSPFLPVKWTPWRKTPAHV